MTTPALQGLEQVFGWLLAASWQASVLALVVLLIQRILGSKLNPRWRYALWLLVLLRLVLPVLPESALSLFQFAPLPPAALAVSVTEPLFVSAPVLPLPDIHPAIPEPTHPFSAYSLLALLWLAGAVSLLVLTWQVNRRFARQVANSPAIVDPELLRLFAEARAELGIRRAIRLIENSQVQSPAIMGLFQPTLLLPADVREKFDARELRFIFLHELAHLKRGDVIVQALIALLQILHWFNPVLWFAFRRMRIDREPATDALVLSRTGEEERERYGLMLIKLLEHFNQRHSLPTLVGIFEDKDQFKRRFSLIARFTRGAYGWSLLGVLLIGILSVACLTKSKAATKSGDDATKNEQAGNVRVQFLAIDMAESDYQAHRGDIDEAVRKGQTLTLQHLATASVVARSAEATTFGHGVFHFSGPNKPNLQIECTPTLNEGKIAIAGSVTLNSTLWSSDHKKLYLQPIPSATFPLAGVLNPTQAQAFPSEGIVEPQAVLDSTFKQPRRLFVFVSVWPETVPAVEGGAPSTETKTQPANGEMLAAVRNGDAVALQKLIDQGVDPKTVKGDYPTLLFEAGSPEVAEILIEHGVDVNARDKYESTLVHLCSSGLSPSGVKNRAQIIRVLLKHGADPNAREEDGSVPLMAARDGATVDVLAEYGADVKAEGKREFGVLLDPQGDASRLKALIQHGAPFDPKTDGPTLMMEAARFDHVDVIAYLLTLGVDPNLKGVWNKEANMYFTPLEQSVIGGNLDAAKFLLEHGAKNEPIMVNGKPGPDEMDNALYNRRKDIVKLFWEHGVRTISELTYAISQGEPIGNIQKLLESGIPPDPPQDKFISPLTLAAELGRLDVVTLLVQKGAKINSPVLRENPLALAAMEGQDEIVEYLLQHGAQVDYEALWNAVWNCNPYPDQRRKDHFEKTVKLLIGAGTLKKMTPEQNGQILEAAIDTRNPGGNATVLKMLLDAGLSPELPLTDKSGKKLNSVVGCYRDYYQKNKDDPANGQEATELKPFLDMLEAADKDNGPKADVTKNPPSKNAALDRDLLLYARNAGTDKVGKGDVDKISQLLAQGANPNAKSEDGTSALVWALNFGKDDAAQVLIQHGADASAEDAAGRNAAWTAAMCYFCPGALELMIKTGVNVKGLDKKGDTIFSAMTLVVPAERGRMNYTRDRVWTDAEFQAYQERERRTVDLLVAAGVDINGKEGSETPLMRTIRSGHYEAARALIEHGANLAIKDEGGYTAINYIFLWAGFHPLPLDLLETMLKHGCDPNAPYFIYTLGSRHPITLLEAVMYVTPAKTPKGTDVTPDDPAALAKAVQLLLDHGADPSFKDADGETALSLARKRHPELVPILEAHAK